MFSFLNWRQSAINRNLEDKFGRPETRIEDILDEDGVKNQLVNPSDDATTYFTKEKIRELTRFVMEMPSNKDDKKNAFRYPFIAQEILKSGSSIILCYFFPKNKKEMDSESTLEDSTVPSPEAEQKGFCKTSLDLYIKDFLKSEQSTDTVLSGYFGTIVTTLQQQRPAEMLRYMNEDPEIEELLLMRLDVQSVSNVFKQILSKDRMLKVLKQASICQDVDTRLNAKNLLLYYIKSLHSMKMELVQTELGFCFDHETWKNLSHEIISQTANMTLDQKMSKKISTELLTELISLLDKNKKFPSAELISIYGVMEDRSNTYLAASVKELREKYLVAVEPQDSWVADFLIEHTTNLSKFLKTLVLPKNTNSMGVESTSLETHLLALLDQARIIYSLEQQKVCQAFADSGALAAMFDLFTKCKWNNFYHQILNKVIRIEDHFLAKFLLACTNQTAREKFPVSGYQGTVNELATFVRNSLPEEKKRLITNCDAWAELSDILKPIFEVENGEREDVFKKAFKKDSFDHFDDDIGLLKYGNITIPSKFSNHSNKNDQEEEEPDNPEEENEIVDALNSHENEDDGKLDQKVDIMEAEGEDKEATEDGNKRSEGGKSPILVFRLSNELDTDGKIEFSDDKDEHDSVKKGEQEILELMESLKQSEGDEKVDYEAEKEDSEAMEEESTQPKKKSPYDIAFGSQEEITNEPVIKKKLTEEKQKKEAEMKDELNNL